MKSILIIIFGMLAASAATADVVVIGHPSNGSTLSQDDVKRIFLGKKSSFPGGGKATPYYLTSGNALREEFNKKGLGKSSSQLKSYWAKLVFTGKGSPPAELGSAAEAKKTVADNVEAVAYIDSADVDGTVKVLFTF